MEMKLLLARVMSSEVGAVLGLMRRLPLSER